MCVYLCMCVCVRLMTAERPSATLCPWMRNEEEIARLNFNCVFHYKRDDARAGGVAIYQNSRDTVNMFTQNMRMIMSSISDLNIRNASVGSVVCKKENDVDIVIVAIYISPS